MKMIVVVAFALMAIATAAPVDEKPIAILRNDYLPNPQGGYSSVYESDNGIVNSVTGELREVPNEEGKLQKVLVVRGTYSYIGEDGDKISITYYADETGFHPEGDSIPKVAARR